MLTILRRINFIEPNVGVCAQLLNTQIHVFRTKGTAQAVKRKKSKAKEATVSIENILGMIRCDLY